MGIDGLLSLLRPVTQKEHISRFKGKRVAVDGLPWLYKGCYGYTFQLNQEVHSNEFMYYILQMLELMNFYGIKPILVFDGRKLAGKSSTLEKRMKTKLENKQKGMENLAKNELGEARKYFSRCIIIDERIIATALDCLRAKGIEIIVAPYEADSQIGKLVECGYADVAISEDSDLLLYGVNMILKLRVNGECDYIDLKSVDRKNYKDNAFLYSWLGYDRYDQIRACVMAGCDYLDNVRGIGIKKAIGFIDLVGSQDKIVEKLLSDKVFKDRVPDGYEKNVLKTVVLFLCARVYNPQTNQLECFSDPQPYNEKLQLSQSELDNLLGSVYEYSADVRNGKVKCTDLQPRECKLVDFKTFFSMPLNRNTLLIQQARYRIKHKEQIASLESAFTKEQLEEAILAEKQEEERLEKERQRLAEEKRLKNQRVDNFLNNIMDSFLDESEEEKEASKTEPLVTQEAQEKSEEDESQQPESDSIDYEKLNPFLKRAS